MIRTLQNFLVTGGAGFVGSAFVSKTNHGSRVKTGAYRKWVQKNDGER